MNTNNAHYNTEYRLPYSKLLAPKHWPSWLLIAIFYGLNKLPYSWQLFIGRRIGNLVYHIMGKWRRIASVNLKLCFPEYSEQQRNKLIKDHFENLGMSLMETGMAWWWDLDDLPHCEIEGLEHFEEAEKKGNGVLLLGLHLTTIDILSRIICRKYPLHVVGRHQNNAVLDTLLKKSRNSKNITLIDRKNLRAIYNALKENKTVWYAPDQDYGPRHSVFAPFFGIPTASITTPSRIASKSKAAVLFVAYYRLANRKGYKVVVKQMPDTFPSEDFAQDSTLINEFAEKAVKHSPEQYLWIHRRFKTRPAGEESFYKKAKA